LVREDAVAIMNQESVPVAVPNSLFKKVSREGEMHLHFNNREALVDLMCGSWLHMREITQVMKNYPLSYT
jgi:hypothetical protein